MVTVDKNIQEAKAISSAISRVDPSMAHSHCSSGTVINAVESNGE
jgi:hypothetical protein